MKTHLRHFYRRHEPGGLRLQQFKAGFGAAVAIAAMGALSSYFAMPFLIAPFGASAVLLFGQARSPLAQPVNVFGGYVLATVVSIVVVGMFPESLAAAAAAVGLAISVMLAARMTHPPAGAVPLVAFLGHMPAATLAPVVIGGSLAMILMAFLHHLLPPRMAYPLRID